MRYSDLDIVSALNVPPGASSVVGKMEERNGIGEENSQQSIEFGVNCNDVNVILDNFSISDDDCCTERSDNSVNDNRTEENDIKGTTKKKKRVMFKCGNNLVMIREIPPRDPTPETESSNESCSDSESESSDEDSDSSNDNCNSKRTNVTKPVKRTNLRVARIIREPPLAFKDLRPKENNAGKKPIKKRSLKRVKKESISKEDTHNKVVDKISIKPKQLQLKPQEKDALKVNESKLSKSQIKRKKVIFNGTESPTLKTNLDCKNSKIVLSERLKRKPNKALLEKRDRKNSSPNPLVISDNFIEESVVSEISQSTDQRPMSHTDKRLYSWLLANGRIPGPEQRSPCISPMWDSKQSGFMFVENTQKEFSSKSVVKAPT